MASNEYPRYEQQQGRPPYNGNGQRNNQRGWQDGAQNGGNYDQPHPRPHRNGYNEQDSYGRYGGGANFQQQQWDDGSYQQPYEPEYHGHPPGNRRDQYPGPDRSYQYDPRFQSPGHGRPAGQSSHPVADPGRRSEDRRQPPPMNLEKKPKPRERILTEPVSPKIAWDNPFPTFNTKKKEDKKEERKQHSSLDKDLSRLELDGPRQATGRSQTSQGHRPRDESRPHTSHSQRPPDVPPPPFLPAIPPAGGPEQRDHHARRPPATGPSQEDYGRDGMQRPLLRPNRTVSDSSVPMAQQPPSAVTNPARGQQFAPTLGYDQTESYDDHYDPPIQQWQQPDTRQNYASRQASEPLYQSPPTRPFDGPVMGRRAYPEDLRVTTDQPAVRDMPDFEAIPISAHGKEEVDVQTGLPYQARQPAYRKKPYQASVPDEAQADLRKTRSNPQQSPANVQPLAGFQFELPSQHPHRPPAEPARTQPYTNAYPNENPAHPYQTYDNRNNFPEWDQQVQPQPQRVATGPGPNGHFPPRAASRAETQPRPAADARQPSPPNAAQFQQTSRRYPEQGIPGYNQPSRPGTSQGPYPHDPNYGPQYDINGYPNGADDGLPPQPYPPDNRAPRAGPVRSGNNQAQYPGQYPTETSSFSSAPPLRPQTSNSMKPRPPPVRHYGERSSSDTMPRPPQGGFASDTSPDALPAHPVPVRPGLMTSNHPEPNNQSHAPAAGSRAPSGQHIQRPRGNQKPEEKAVTVAELNSLQAAMKNDPHDYATGLKLAKKLVQAASTLASDGGKADPKTTAKNRERYIFDAHKIVKKLVNAGYSEAMFYLADCHGQGLLGLAVDPREAFALYQSAAKLNHPQSAYRVAVCCEIGQDEGGGTRRDPVKAVQWYKRAATLGDTPAMYKMGMVLLKGLLGQQKNPREALSWLKRAAERADEDNPHALHELGLLYESASPTDHIIRDEKYALQLFQQAAELGYKYSQFRLGSAYEYGLIGCSIDARQSIAWYSAAAAQGEHQSELALSGWYLTGSPPILEQSDTEAYLWARKAAMSGLAKAEYAMGYFTEVGIGASANIEEAKRWYWKAAAQNLPRARERLEDLKRGGQKMQKTRVSRSAVGKQNEGECTVM